MTSNSVDVALYLLNKYKYPLNIEYSSDIHSNNSIYTLLTEHRSVYNAQFIKLLLDHGADPAKPMCSATSPNAIMIAIEYRKLKVIAQYIRSGIDINSRSYSLPYKFVLLSFEMSVLCGYHDIAEILLISGCSCGVYSLKNNHMLTYPYCETKLTPAVKKLMKEWKVQENNVTPLQQRCRSVILNHLSPQADLKIENLPLPGRLFKFLNISEIDEIVDAHKEIDKD